MLDESADPVAPLRNDGKPLRALEVCRELISQAIDEGYYATARESWASHIGGEECLVLDALQAADAEGRGVLLAKLFDDSNLQTVAGTAWDMFAARLDLLGALGDTRPDDIENRIWSYADIVELKWKHEKSSLVKKIEQEEMPVATPAPGSLPREPAFMAGLPGDQFREAFRQVADERGWTHPGLLLAGETLAMFHRPPKMQETLSTWIMFAVNDERNPQGILARLTLERLPRGCGLLVPDPRACGYLQMDKEFSSGLLHAWYAARILRPHWLDAAKQMYDVRWRIDLLEGCRELPDRPVDVSPSGSSAEAAFACGILALHPEQAGPLDVHSGITAQFKSPLTANLELDQVGDIDIKTLAGRLTRERVSRILVSAQQPKTGLRSSQDQFQFQPVADLKEAFEALQHWPQITQAVREAIFQEAARLRKVCCGPAPADLEREGADYVPSPMEERLDRRPESEERT
ncbi:MAG: hypothetical protein ACKV0T_17660, partial [Planctomycetales bacterium]